MAFPPKKPSPGGPPPANPNNDPFGGASPFLPVGPGGPPPIGGMAPPPIPPKPGQGMDPVMAMLHGLGPDPLGMGAAQPQGPPLGPNGMPVGGSLPPAGDNDGDETMGGSDLLKALTSMVGGGDPYATSGMPPNLNVGPQDPNMGIQQMLQALALGGMGVGGGPPAMPGGSGLDIPPSLMGQTVGL